MSASPSVSFPPANSSSASASEEEAVQGILLQWQRATRASRHGPSHASVLQAAALAIFGSAALREAGALKRRYRQLAVCVHPDKNASAQASEAFQVLQSCFEFASSNPDNSDGSGDGGEAIRHTAPAPPAAPAAAASSPTSSTTFPSESSTSRRSSSSSSSSDSDNNRDGPRRGQRYRYTTTHATHGPHSRGTPASGPPRPSPFTPLSRASATRTAPQVPVPPDVFGTGSSACGPFASATPPCGIPVPNVFFDDDGADGGSEVPPPPPPPPVFDDGYVHRTPSPTVPAEDLSEQASHRHSREAERSQSHRHSHVHRRDTSSRSLSPSLQSDKIDHSTRGRPAPPRRFSHRPASQTATAHHPQRGFRVELPTLAELLAQLDVDDNDAMEDGGGTEVEEDEVHWTTTHGWGAPPTPQSPPARKSATRTAAPAMRSVPAVPHHIDVTPTSTSHSLGSARVDSLFDLPGRGLRQSATRAAAAPSNAFGVGSTHGSSGSSAVRSRRAGGGGSASSTTGSGQRARATEVRCACGKALRGRCFLCEE